MSKIIIESLNSSRKRRIPSQTKLILVGLTPGRVQHDAINKSKRSRDGAFKGQMRTRLFKWFNEIGINKALGVKDKDQLFLDPVFDKTVFITSLLREPVYYLNGKNYSGKSPYPWKDQDLIRLYKDTCKILQKAPKESLIVPCGEVVSKVMEMELNEAPVFDNILLGFPHPSPLNSHGDKKLQLKKEDFKKKVKQILG